jgi:hypothetical protein
MCELMVWGSFSSKKGRGGIWFMPRGQIITAAVHERILEEKLLHFREIQQVKFFQHEGEPCHMAKSVTRWLHDHHIPIIGPWPGSSTDLNSIENLWMQMKRKVAAHNPTSAESLQKVIKTV